MSYMWEQVSEEWEEVVEATINTGDCGGEGATVAM